MQLYLEQIQVYLGPTQRYARIDYNEVERTIYFLGEENIRWRGKLVLVDRRTSSGEENSRLKLPLHNFQRITQYFGTNYFEVNFRCKVVLYCFFLLLLLLVFFSLHVFLTMTGEHC